MPEVRNRSILYIYMCVVSLLLSFSLNIIGKFFGTSVHSIDGAFQTYSSLARLSNGEVPFHDYFPYLGLISTSIPGPLFLIFGGTGLFASNAAVLILLFIIWPLYIFFIFRINRIGLIESTVLIMFALLLSGFSPFEPGNSLRPIRAALPFFVSILIYIAMNPDLEKNRNKNISSALVWGCALIIAPLWSGDFGPATVICFIMTWVLFVANWRRIVTAVSGVLIISIIILVLNYIILVSLSDLRGWWGFQVGMSRYQFWLFGPWGDGFQVLRISDILDLVPWSSERGLLTVLGLLVWFSALLVRCVTARRQPGDVLTFAIGTATILGCMAPQVGGHIDPSYWATANYLVCALLISEAVKWPWIRQRIASVWDGTGRRFYRGATWRDVTMVVLCVLCIAWQGGRAADAAIQFMRVTDPAEVAALANARSVIGGYPSRDAKAISCFARLGAAFDGAHVPRDQRLAGSYLSALHLAARAGQPMQVDSVIHLLGDEFRTQNQALIEKKKPILFTTIASDYSVWERWNIRVNWDFFEYIYKHYEPIVRSDQHIVWIRKGASSAAPRVGDGPARAVTCAAQASSPRSARISVSAPDSPVPVWALLSIDARLSRGETLSARLSRPIVQVDEGRDGPPITGIGGPYPKQRYGVNHAGGQVLVPVEIRPGRSRTFDLVVDPSPEWSLNVASCAGTITVDAPPPDAMVPRLDDCDAFVARVAERLPELGYK